MHDNNYKHEEKEDDILISFSLRFDGYKYMKEAGFKPEKVLSIIFKTGDYKISKEEQLTLFFWLQRGLYKWGLEYEPRNGGYWKVFRTLFLMTYKYKVPVKYRAGDSWKDWENEYKEILQECYDFIKQIHEGIKYLEK
jgi:hypothetical protein